MFADEGIINLKHEVLNMVAKLAFEGVCPVCVPF